MIMPNSWKHLTKTTSKYHNQKTIIDGIYFDSKKEAIRYQELKLLERCGEIENLQLQQPFVLIPKSKYGRAIKYIADFTYTDKQKGEWIVEDTKGIKTDVYRLKKRLMAEKFNIVIKET